jgi:WNK lysine deficient protein kinase
MHALKDPELFGLERGSAEEQRIVNELISEVVMLASLHCDKVVSFHGVCFESGTMQPKYIILELASGSLDWFLRHHGSVMTLSQLRGYCRDMLTGLEYLHTRLPPIMHRDIKPANILVFISGDRVTCKLGDVGLARFSGAGSVVLQPTCGVGTVFYMAPEVMAGLGYDHSVDVFSFGVMVAEIVGRYWMEPARRGGDLGTRMALIHDAVTYLQTIDEGLSRLVAGCCEVDVSSRMSATAALGVLG